jgi:1-pyrroline-4-hydroxy-2-carboxylate deaminase
MTPCKGDRSPDFDALVAKAKELIAEGMSAVVYCGSMGDWPLLTDAQRMEGVERLVKAGIPVIVGTGALNTASAVIHSAHAQRVGAKGLMVIPRVLSRGSVVAAQKAHFQAILQAAPDLPAVIYNSPYYGFRTPAELFFALRAGHPNLVGFKEFGGRDDMRYAAEHITSQDDDVTLMVGVDTAVVYGFVNCGAKGAITGIGNVLPKEFIHLSRFASAPAAGDVRAGRLAKELEAALAELSTFDEGPDLVLFFKYLLTLKGENEYALNFNETDCLTPSQRGYAEAQFKFFNIWYKSWCEIHAA